MTTPVQPHLPPPTDEADLEIITAIQNMANSVIANAASRTLAKWALRICHVATLLIDAFQDEIEIRVQAHLFFAVHVIPSSQHHFYSTVSHACAKIHLGFVRLFIGCRYCCCHNASWQRAACLPSHKRIAQSTKSSEHVRSFGEAAQGIGKRWRGRWVR